MSDATGAFATRLPADLEPLRLLGRGTTGEVWLARERSLRRLVAVKTPRPELASDASVRARFEREARAAARLRHPSVVAIHRIDRLSDGAPYLVMEYVEGPTLADRIRAEGPLQAPLAARLLRQLAEALTDAHDAGVLHRDVRPANVILAQDGERAVLTDFGIAGILETGSELVTRLTRPGEAVGDAAYRSPEQLRGEPASPAGDIYAWGLLAFETLTGELPFEGLTVDALATAHLRTPPRALQDALPGADPALGELIARCLAKDPNHRPSARGVARALEKRERARASDAPESAEPPSPVAGFLAELRRRRVYNVALAYAAIAFVLLQGAELVLPELPVPAWSYTVLVAVTLAGFPVALVLSWVYDLTGGRLSRTEAPAPAGSRVLRWLLPALGLLLSLLLAVAIGWWVLGG